MLSARIRESSSKLQGFHGKRENGWEKGSLPLTACCKVSAQLTGLSLKNCTSQNIVPPSVTSFCKSASSSALPSLKEEARRTDQARTYAYDADLSDLPDGHSWPAFFNGGLQAGQCGLAQRLRLFADVTYIKHAGRVAMIPLHRQPCSRLQETAKTA